MFNKFIFATISLCTLCAFVEVQAQSAAAKQPVKPGAAGAPQAPAPQQPQAPKPSPLYIETTGLITESARANVKPQINGIVTKIYAEPGAEVKKGDLILEIDPKQYQITLEQQKAAQQKNLALFNLAKITLDRYTLPAQTEAITKLAYDQYQTNFKTAEAQVKADKINIMNAQYNLARTRITAPISGRLGVFAYGPGETINTMDPKKVLTDIRQLSPAHVNIQLSTAELERIMQHSPINAIKIEVSLMADKQTPFNPKKAHSGHLVSIDNHFDPQTGKILAIGTIPNDKHAFWPGQSVKVRIYAEEQPQGKK